MTAVPQVTGRELSNPPTDGISNLRFSNHSDHLLVSSWDKSVRLYDASANVLRGEFMHGGAVLDCCFHDDSSGFSAGADNTVRRLVFGYGREDILGRHDAPVRCIEYSYATGQVITGSWDKTLKCWDPRGASGQERSLVGTYSQPERVYSLSLVGNRLVVATAGRNVNVYDLRNMSQLKKHVAIVKKHPKKWHRHQSDMFKCVPSAWRKPKGIDNRVRRRFKGQMVMPSIGFGSNKKTRHMMPSGHKAFLVNNTRDVDLLLMHNRTYAAEIAHAVSSRKRVEIIAKAKALGVKVTNPKARVTKSS